MPQLVRLAAIHVMEDMPVFLEQLHEEGQLEIEVVEQNRFKTRNACKNIVN